MQPFRVLEPLAALEREYPSAAKVVDAVALGSEPCAREISLLWLSEGVPWVFRENPPLFVAVRSWLATQLGVKSKDVTVVGSARLGASLAPETLGRAFGAQSDLDLAVISSELFRGCEESFRRWSADLVAGEITPTPAEEKYWNTNIGIVAANTRMGFIDPWKVPLRRRYRESQLVVATTSLLTRKLAATTGAPHVERASARVYRDWDSFARQVAVNLAAAAESLRSFRST